MINVGNNLKRIFEMAGILKLIPITEQEEIQKIS